MSDLDLNNRLQLVDKHVVLTASREDRAPAAGRRRGPGRPGGMGMGMGMGGMGSFGGLMGVSDWR